MRSVLELKSSALVLRAAILSCPVQHAPRKAANFELKSSSREDLFQTPEPGGASQAKGPETGAQPSKPQTPESRALEATTALPQDE